MTILMTSNSCFGLNHSGFSDLQAWWRPQRIKAEEVERGQSSRLFQGIESDQVGPEISAVTERREHRTTKIKSNKSSHLYLYIFTSCLHEQINTTPWITGNTRKAATWQKKKEKEKQHHRSESRVETLIHRILCRYRTRIWIWFHGFCCSPVIIIRLKHRQTKISQQEHSKRKEIKKNCEGFIYLYI